MRLEISRVAVSNACRPIVQAPACNARLRRLG